MRWLSPIERRVLRDRRRRAAIALLSAYLVLALLDRPAFQALYVGPDRLRALEAHDLYRTLRVLGSMWIWVLVAGVLGAAAPAWRGGLATGLRLLASAGLGGLAAEMLKVPIGRLRPIETNGEYVYKGLPERFTDPASGMPSSHVAVAFGALALLGFVFPRAWWVLLLGGLGCAATRVVSGAHFLTDAYVAALVGYASARLLRPGGWGAGRPPVLVP